MGVGALYTSRVLGPMVFFLILRINLFLWALSLLFSQAVALSLITFFRVSTSQSSESDFGEITSTSSSLEGSCCTGAASWMSISSSFSSSHLSGEGDVGGS